MSKRKEYKQNHNETQFVSYKDGCFVRHPRFMWTMRLLNRYEWTQIPCGWHVCGICGSGNNSGSLVKVSTKQGPLYIDFCERCFRNIRKGGGTYIRIVYNSMETNRRKF